MKILAGAVTRANPAVLRAHLKTMEWQNADADIDFVYITDPEISKGSVELLQETGAGVNAADPKPEDAQYDINETTHRWTMPTFAWLAREKQKILATAVQNGYDAVWLVDSDLLCDPGTLSSLINAQKPIVSGVFYTKWQPEAPALPQVWLRHPYDMRGRGMDIHEFLSQLENRELVQVAGLGACTLIRTPVLNRVGYFPLVPGLPQGGMWQGEDRHFCVRAERRHIPLYADAWPQIWHCYRPSDEADLEHWLEQFESRIDIAVPEVGDLISATLEPLEEPALANHIEHVRGRLGQLQLVPDLERTLLSMEVGEERLESIHFPIWYPIAQYRNQSRTVRIRLLDAKPFAPHPNLGPADKVPDAAEAKEALSGV